jgi:hypothetical protein
MANLTPAERERRSQNMKNIQAKKLAEKLQEVETITEEVKEGLGVRTPGERNKRPRRNLFSGTQQKLAVYGEIPGYRLYIFNDVPGRIEQALASGYEFVMRDELEIETSRTATEANTSTDSRVRYSVSRSGEGPLYAYLMKIPQEWFEADQAEHLEKIAASQKAMTRGRGSEADRIGQTYIPNGRKNALETTQIG